MTGLTDSMEAITQADSSVFAAEWEAYCKADYTAYKERHPPPFIADFWSGGAFFNASERWSDDYRRHYMRDGEAWWNARGFTVTSWPRNLPITVAELGASNGKDSDV